MASIKYTDEELNYYRVCKVTTNIITDGLRTVFKQEWDNRYKATYGQWQDTAQNAIHFINLESPKSQKKNARLLAVMKNGNTKEWDCTCLFYAILYSDGIGPFLNTTVENGVDELRRFRNKVFAHTRDGKLTEADFKTAITTVTSAFTALKLDTALIEKIKNQTSFPTEELEEMKRQLEKEKKRNEEPRPFCVLPPKPSHDTINRLNEVGEIRKEMERLRNTKKNEVTVVYLSGNPGCGKSEVARQVGEQFFDEKGTGNISVMTLNASSIDTLVQSYVELAGRISCDEDSITGITTSKDLSQEEKLNSLRSLISPRLQGYSSWLIIVDNVSNLKSVSKYWPQAGEKTNGVGQILVTTQDSSSIPSDPYTYHLPLKEGMNQDDAISMVSEISGFSSDKNILLKVANALDFQPLALASAAVYMKRIKSSDWNKYLQKLEEGKREATETVYKKTSSTYQATMTEAVRMAVEKEENENEVMKYAFQFLSVIAPEPISLDYVVQYVTNCLPDEDKDLVRATVCSSSLLLSSGEDECKDVRVHQVVYNCFEENFLSGKSEVRWEMFRHFPTIESLDLKHDEDFDKKYSLLPHFTTFISKIHYSIVNFQKEMDDAIRENGIGMIEYISEIHCTLSNYGRYDSKILKIFLFIADGIDDNKHPSFAFALKNIGNIHYHLGRYDEAMKYLKKASVIQESQDGKNDLMMVDTLNGLVSTLCEIPGKEKEAKCYAERALQLIKKLQLNGEENIFEANIFHKEGLIFKSMGKREQEKECYEKGLNMLKNKSGKMRDLIFCNIQKEMGNVLRQLGKLEESKRVLREGLAVFEKNKDFHDKRIVISLLTVLGHTCSELEQFEDAIVYYERVLAIRKDTTAVLDHPRKVDILKSLARCVTSLGKHKKAIEYRSKVLESMNDESDPEFSSTLYEMGINYLNLKQNKQAIERFERALTIKTRTDSKQHPELKLIFYYLGISYVGLELYLIAKMFLEKTLIIERELDGEEPSNLPSTLFYLGVSYLRLQEHEKAKLCLEEAKTHMEKGLASEGTQHHEMARTIYFLGMSYFNLKQHHKVTTFLTKALPTIEKDLGCEELAVTLFHLGASYCALNQNEQALCCLEEAQRIGNSFYGEEHQEMILIHYHLGVSYFLGDKFKQAISCLEKALKIGSGFYSKGHPQMTDIHYCLAISHCAAVQNFKQAKKYLEKALTWLTFRRLLYEKDSEFELFLFSARRQFLWTEQTQKAKKSLTLIILFLSLFSLVICYSLNLLHGGSMGFH